MTLVFSIILALGKTNEPLCIQKTTFSHSNLNKHEFKGCMSRNSTDAFSTWSVGSCWRIKEMKSAENQIFAPQLSGKHNFSAQMFWPFPEFMPFYNLLRH